MMYFTETSSRCWSKMCTCINLKDSDQSIRLDITILRTTGMYNLVCMEMWSKADSMECKYTKITAVDIHTTFSKYRQIIFSCQDNNGIPLVHNTVDIKSAYTVEEKLSGFNQRTRQRSLFRDGNGNFEFTILLYHPNNGQRSYRPQTKHAERMTLPSSTQIYSRTYL